MGPADVQPSVTDPPVSIPDDIPRALVDAWNDRDAAASPSRNDAGVWRCVSAHNTDVVEGMETHAREKGGALRAVDYRDPKGT